MSWCKFERFIFTAHGVHHTYTENAHITHKKSVSIIVSPVIDVYDLGKGK